jgi:hypothetical protein
MQIFLSLSRAAWGLALVASLSACGGGGSEAMSAADLTVNKLRQVTAVPAVDNALCAADTEGYTLVDGQCLAASDALGKVSRIIRTTSTTVTATITADQLFAWAQTSFPTLFPGSPATATANGFVYRAYSSGNAIAVTSTLAGVPAGTILVLGPFTGNALLTVGTLSSLNCAIAPSNCTVTNPNPGTGGSGGNYADCLGTVLMTPGHTYQIDLSSSTNGAVVQTTTNKYVVNQQTSFKGNTAIELQIDTTVLSGAGSGTTSRVKNYSYLTGDVYSTYGQIVTLAIPGFGSYDMTAYYSPAIKTPTSLASGQTYSVNYTLKYESSNPLFTSFLPVDVSYAYTFTYFGKESVTTPAGTFSACKTSTQTINSSANNLGYSWLVAEGRYKGLFLKSDDGKGTVAVATKLLLDGS